MQTPTSNIKNNLVTDPVCINADKTGMCLIRLNIKCPCFDRQLCLPSCNIPIEGKCRICNLRQNKE